MNLGQVSTIALAILLITGCQASENTISTTGGAFTDSEVTDLERLGAAGDRKALRELDVFYGLEGRTKDRERIHALRLKIADPEALDEEALKLIGTAEKAAGTSEKRRLLNDALEIARKSATIQGVDEKHIEKEMLVALILREIERTESR